MGPLDKAQARAFTDAVRAAAGGDIDVVYDGVGGSYSEPALRSLGWDGRFLVVGFPASIASVPMNLPLLKSCHIIGVFWGASIERDRTHFRESVAELLDWYSGGSLTPLVSDRFPLARGGEAIALLSSRKAVGKVVVELE
jgi:NADPH2:quinone reductase